MHLSTAKIQFPTEFSKNSFSVSSFSQQTLLLNKNHKKAANYKLLWIESGDGKLLISHKNYRLKNNQIFLLTPKQFIDWDPHSTFSGVICQLSPNLFKNYFHIINLQCSSILEDIGHNSEYVLPASEYSAFKTLLNLLVEETKRRDIDGKMLSPLLTALTFTLFRHSKYFSEPQFFMEDNRITKLQNLIDNHFSSHHQVTFYANKLNLSERYLNSISNQILGQTVTQIIHQKLNLKAKEMLVNNNCNIKEIAENLGFDDPSYFARFFKRMNNTSPTKFRKSNNG